MHHKEEIQFLGAAWSTYWMLQMARFYISDGMYSIEEIKKMLVHIKAEKKRQDKYLKQSIQPLKEKNGG